MADGSSVKYGRYYWEIKSKLSKDGEIYLMADRIEITPTGDLLAIGHVGNNTPDEKPCLMLALAKGQWIACYAASCLDGAPVAVDHWKGEIVDPMND